MLRVLYLVTRQVLVSRSSAWEHGSTHSHSELKKLSTFYTVLPIYERKPGLAPCKPVIYEFIQTCQIALSKRLLHLKILMAAHLVWQTGRPKFNPFILQLNHYNGSSALTL